MYSDARNLLVQRNVEHDLLPSHFSVCSSFSTHGRLLGACGIPPYKRLTAPHL